MWLVFAVLLHARFRPAMRGKSVMVLTIVAFGFLVFTWVGVEALRLPTTHGIVQDHDHGEDKDTVSCWPWELTTGPHLHQFARHWPLTAPNSIRGLDLVTRTFPGNECVILSTCNRVELYVASNPDQVAETVPLPISWPSFTESSPRRLPRIWSGTTTKGPLVTCSGWRPAWRA